MHQSIETLAPRAPQLDVEFNIGKEHLKISTCYNLSKLHGTFNYELASLCFWLKYLTVKCNGVISSVSIMVFAHILRSEM